MKDFLLGFKFRFIKKHAPTHLDHWNEDDDHINFYFPNGNSSRMIKPLWLKIIEKIVYK